MAITGLGYKYLGFCSFYFNLLNSFLDEEIGDDSNEQHDLTDYANIEVNDFHIKADIVSIIMW